MAVYALLLAVLVLLVFLLCALVSQRLRAFQEREKEYGFHGRAFEASPVCQRLAEVRQDYIQQARRHPSPSGHHMQLLKSARFALQGMAWFVDCVRRQK